MNIIGILSAGRFVLFLSAWMPPFESSPAACFYCIPDWPSGNFFQYLHLYMYNYILMMHFGGIRFPLIGIFQRLQFYKGLSM